RQKPQIHIIPTPDIPKSYTQQTNKPSNITSHNIKSNPAVIIPSRTESYKKKQTTSNSTQNTQNQKTSTATDHSSINAPKLRY
ncbi:hypothetical protein DF186_20970, partial [Enterococcus hirae]